MNSRSFQIGHSWKVSNKMEISPNTLIIFSEISQRFCFAEIRVSVWTRANVVTVGWHMALYHVRFLVTMTKTCQHLPLISSITWDQPLLSRHSRCDRIKVTRALSLRVRDRHAAVAGFESTVWTKGCAALQGWACKVSWNDSQPVRSYFRQAGWLSLCTGVWPNNWEFSG